MRKGIQKVNRVLVFVFVFLIVGQSIFVAPTQGAPASKENMAKKVEKLKSKTIVVGRVEKNKANFEIGDSIIPSYTCMNLSYVLVSDLKKIGANVAWDGARGKTIIYDLNQPQSPTPAFEVLPENSLGYLGRDAVYINHQEVPAVFVGGKALIPAKWVPSLLLNNNSTPVREIEELDIYTEEALQEDPQEYDLNNSPDLEALEYIDTEIIEGANTEEIDMDTEVNTQEVETDTINPEPVPVQKGIRGINIWFNGKDYFEEPYDFSALEPGEFAYYQDHKYDKNEEFMYVGFVISEVNGVTNLNEPIHKAWLKHSPYYTVPEGMSKEVLNTLFPGTRVKGIMRYAAGGFAKGEIVNVKQASTGSAYYLWNSKGQVVKVPWASVAIQKSPVTKEQATTQQIEQYINSGDFSSKTNYFVWTDIYRQRTYVFQGSNNKWKLVKNFLSTTGRDTSLTPVGRYTLNVRVPYFGSDKYRVKNAYAFIGTSYLYHSILYDPTGSYLIGGWGQLGNKASSGCIRLAVEDSVWFYKTLPVGTGIFIN